jgi:hypothetical protein
MRFTVWPTHKAASSNLINTLLENEKKEYFMPKRKPTRTLSPPPPKEFFSRPFPYLISLISILMLFKSSEYFFFRNDPHQNSLPIPCLLCSSYISSSSLFPKLQYNKCRVLLTQRGKIKFWPIRVHNSRTLPESSWLIRLLYFVMSFDIAFGDRGSTVVKVLRFKSEGRWFDPRWCHWNFSLT